MTLELPNMIYMNTNLDKLLKKNIAIGIRGASFPIV